MISETYVVSGKVEKFPQKGGWYYVRVPKKISDEVAYWADRGLVAITATVGAVSWKTSLLPYGDGTQFIALNARVRETERIGEGDSVKVEFELRER